MIGSLLLGACLLVAIALLHRASFSLRLALFGYVALWLMLPLAYRLWAGGDPVEDDAALWYGPVMVAHAVGVATIVLLVLTVPSPFARSAGEGRLARWQFDSRALGIVLALGAAIITAVRVWQVREAGGDFASLVALNISRERETLGGFTLVTALSSAYLSLALATLASGSSTAFGTRVVAWLCVTVVSVQSVLIGLRAFLLLPFLGLFLIAGNAEPARRPRLWLAAWTAGALALLLVPVAALILGVTRVRSDSTEGSTADVLEAFAQLDPNDRLRLFTAAANLKFDGFTTGATLLALDGAGGGGLRPLTSALFSPVPRVLLPSKPVPISADGEQSGVPFVRAAQRFGAVEAGMVVPVSPAAITVWELGWVGLGVFVATNVLVLWLIEAWLRTGTIIPGAFAFSLLSYPSFEFTLQAPSSLLRDLLRLGVVWVALLCVALLLRRQHESSPAVASG